jgi:hypothetical protein
VANHPDDDPVMREYNAYLADLAKEDAKKDKEQPPT